MEEILKQLEQDHWKRLEEEEGITKDHVELVMLDIAFSPVIPFKGGHPVEVIETVGGNYIVPGFPAPSVSPEMLKVMRYRYLAQRKGITFV